MSESEYGAKVGNMEMIPFYLTGRGRSGSDSTGTLFHALPAGSELTFRVALCGKKPGRLSNGWSEAWKPEQVISCPKCKKKLAQQAVQS